MTHILGISAFYHDSAAALITDGKIISAAQEERFSRIKHDAKYPFNAVEYVLKNSNLKLSQIDYIVFFERKKKILVISNNYSFSFIWSFNSFKPRISCGTIYIYNFLSDINFRNISFLS